MRERWYVWACPDGEGWYASPPPDRLEASVGFNTWREAYAYADAMART